MEWQVLLQPRARQQLAAIRDRRIQRQITDAAKRLRHDPDKQGKPLSEALAGRAAGTVRLAGRRAGVTTPTKTLTTAPFCRKVPAKEQSFPIPKHKRMSGKQEDGMMQARHMFPHQAPPLPDTPDQEFHPLGLPRAPDIAVIGIGGAGTNAVNRMIAAHVQGVRFVALNTDTQVLALSRAEERIHLGRETTQGRGAGGNPTLGMRAAEESRAELQEALRGADMVFIAAGMGGGTGTGVAPFVARMAREQGALTVGIVTLPFSFEGSRRRAIAEQGTKLLQEGVDALIMIPNDRLLTAMPRGISLAESFRIADDILRQGVQGIAEVITVPGLVNVDFADVRAVMSDAGNTVMSLGEAMGEERALQAAAMAVAGNWLGASIRGAKRILLNITGGSDLTLFEVTDIATHVAEAVDTSADVTLGAIIDSQMAGAVRVTLIAADIPAEDTMDHR
jgi:cell division protein FtsZ